MINFLLLGFPLPQTSPSGFPSLVREEDQRPGNLARKARETVGTGQKRLRQYKREGRKTGKTLLGRFPFDKVRKRGSETQKHEFREFQVCFVFAKLNQSPSSNPVETRLSLIIYFSSSPTNPRKPIFSFK